jgi:hypothetical protein
MDTDQEQTAPEAADETSGTPAQTVRVPNVSPGAKSGLDHTVIGADALDPDTADDADEPTSPEEPDTEALPDGDVDAKVAWVDAAEDQDTASSRADKVYAWAAESGPSPEYLSDLSAKLRRAVYGEPETKPESAADLQVAPDSEVPGTVEVTAGTPGPAENAETGEVTQAGEPLPTIEQEGGTPLDPPDAIDSPAAEDAAQESTSS